MDEQGPTPAKSVRAVVEIGPNYIFHLLAVAGVGFESGYAARYRHTVRHEDVALLRASAHLLTFAEGRAGELVEVAVFFPAYMNLAGEREIREYFDLLERGIAGDHGAFVERYRVHLEKWRLWPPAQVDKYFAGMGLLGPYGPALHRLREVYAGNLAAYEDRVWPEERPGLESVAARLNRHFAQRDVIGRWEQVTRIPFKADRYEIILCPAIENGPNANSLGYDRNVFYSGSDFDWMMQFISHETGTHILIDVLGDPRLRRYDFDTVYRAYENLARFYNTLVLETRDLYPMPPAYQHRRFDEIYAHLHSAHSEISPADLLVAGVDAFLSSR